MIAKNLFTALALLATQTLSPDPAAAANDVSFAGKTIQIMIGSNPGGGFDQYARLLGRHLAKYLPGSPTIIPRNMGGAGGMRLLNYGYNVATQDGTVIFTMHENLPVLQRIGAAGVQYDARKIHSIGRLAAGNEALLADPKSGFKSYKDLFEHELTVGDTGGGTLTMVLPILQKMGMKLKIIAGYQGTAETRLAMQRREVDGMSITIASILASAPDMITPGVVVPLIQVGTERESVWNDVPLATEVATSQKFRDTLDVLSAGQEIGRSYWVGPNVSKEARDTLMKAFAKLATDEELKQEAEQQHLILRFADGPAMDAYVERIMATSNEVADLLRASVPNK